MARSTGRFEQRRDLCDASGTDGYFWMDVGFLANMDNTRLIYVVTYDWNRSFFNDIWAVCVSIVRDAPFLSALVLEWLKPQFIQPSLQGDIEAFYLIQSFRV